MILECSFGNVLFEQKSERTEEREDIVSSLPFKKQPSSLYNRLILLLLLLPRRTLEYFGLQGEVYNTTFTAAREGKEADQRLSLERRNINLVLGGISCVREETD